MTDIIPFWLDIVVSSGETALEGARREEKCGSGTLSGYPPPPAVLVIIF